MHIRKSAEPKEWTEYKNIPGVQFSGIPALQESLYREQGYLCAYCERRIPVRDKMSTEDHRIEHWHCRDKYPDEVFSYGNLLMCCPGQIRGGESHCDVRKGNDIIEWSPLKKECTDSIRYSLNGTILSSNASWDKELNEKLNLNHEILKRNREQTLRGVIEGIISKRGKHILWTQKDVKDQLEKWSNKHDDGNGHAVYYPFNGIVVYFLKKKLAMLSKKGA